MLSQIVRPMVRTQIRLLASCQATRSTLTATIAQWLGFLGVHAQVTHLSTQSGRIQVMLSVGRPEACDSQDWQQILHNLEQGETSSPAPSPVRVAIPSHQQTKLCRLLAYLLQVGNPELPAWDTLEPQLRQLGLDESTLAGVRSALKVPQSLELLLEGMEPDVVAIALPKAVSIALLDRQVNPSEDRALTALLQAIKAPLTAG